MSLKKRIIGATVLVAALGAGGIAARVVAKPPFPAPTDLPAGSKLAAFTLQNQRGEERRVDEGTQALLFSRDKDLAKAAFEILGKKDAAFLDERRAAFILDISQMPAPITWAIAKPRMRRHAFPLLLDEGPGPSKTLPTRQGQLTLVLLDKLEVRQVKYLSTAEEISKELDALGR